MSKREFVLLAHKFNEKTHLGGWFISEKLDGMRAIWDGGITRGLLKKDVLWANTAKDGRYVNEQYATGLWSRYGNVIHAPDWFLDQLPAIPLDGEMYTRVANRQAIFSTIKDLVPSPDWQFIEYHVFDMVPLDFWLMDGKINNTGFIKVLCRCFKWAMDRAKLEYYPTPMTTFQTTIALMHQKFVETQVCKIHPQERLPQSHDEAMARIIARSTEIIEAGGEGLIIKSPNCYWRGERVHEMMKYKPTDDAEGTVIGYITGRETDKGSKLLGMMGALVIRLENGKEMELSGFTDCERELGVIAPRGQMPEPACEARGWAVDHSEEHCPDWIEAVHFPRGTVVTFKYRGLSSYGVPQEARFWRKRNET